MQLDRPLRVRPVSHEARPSLRMDLEFWLLAERELKAEQAQRYRPHKPKSLTQKFMMNSSTLRAVVTSS